MLVVGGGFPAPLQPSWLAKLGLALQKGGLA